MCGRKAGGPTHLQINGPLEGPEIQPFPCWSHILSHRSAAERLVGCPRRPSYQRHPQCPISAQEAMRAASHSCLSLFSFSLLLPQMVVSTNPLLQVQTLCPANTVFDRRRRDRFNSVSGSLHLRKLHRDTTFHSFFRSDPALLTDTLMLSSWPFSVQLYGVHNCRFSCPALHCILNFVVTRLNGPLIGLLKVRLSPHTASPPLLFSMSFLCFHGFFNICKQAGRGCGGSDTSGYLLSNAVSLAEQDTMWSMRVLEPLPPAH